MSSKEYKDLDNLAKLIKTEINKIEKLSCNYKKNSNVSKKFRIAEETLELLFDLNFVSYDKKNQATRLILLFENTKYNIYYINNSYNIVVNDNPVEITSSVLKKILDIEIKNLRKTEKNDIFPFSICIQYSSIKPNYPIESPFSCPECKDGRLLVLDDKSLLYKPHKTFNEMIQRDYYDEYDYDWFKYSFAGYLTCSKCGEQIAVLGDYAYSELGVYINNRNSDLLREDLYTIKYFDRVKDFISLDCLQDEEMKKILRDSFLLYFTDLTSCANKIRVFLDLYLTQLGVPETLPDGGFYSLGNRIKNCKKIKAEQKKKLTILKNVGNEGSHGGGIISHNELYKTYKVLEEIINQNRNIQFLSSLEKRFS